MEAALDAGFAARRPGTAAQGLGLWKVTWCIGTARVVVVGDPALDLAHAIVVAVDITVAISQIPRLWLERPGPTSALRLWCVAGAVGAAHVASVCLELTGLSDAVAAGLLAELGEVILISLASRLGEQ